MKRKRQSKGYTRLNIQIPQQLFDDLQALSQMMGTDFKDDLIARMAFSLAHNDTLMAGDRLRRLIFCKQLSYEYQQRKQRKLDK